MRNRSYKKHYYKRSFAYRFKPAKQHEGKSNRHCRHYYVKNQFYPGEFLFCNISNCLYKRFCGKHYNIGDNLAAYTKRPKDTPKDIVCKGSPIDVWIYKIREFHCAIYKN